VPTAVIPCAGTTLHFCASCRLPAIATGLRPTGPCRQRPNPMPLLLCSIFRWNATTSSRLSPTCSTFPCTNSHPRG
jgi:hypothetical protein